MKLFNIFKKTKPVAVFINNYRDMYVYYTDATYEYYPFVEANQPKLPLDKYTKYKYDFYINEEVALKNNYITNIFTNEKFRVLAKNKNTSNLIIIDTKYDASCFLVSSELSHSYREDYTLTNLKLLDEGDII